MDKYSKSVSKTITRKYIYLIVSDAFTKRSD